MIELKNIEKYYQTGGEALHVLKQISLKIEQGEMVAIMGPSGSGKSTLIHVLGFIDTKYEGEYLFEEQNIRDSNDKVISQIRNQTVGFVFQNFSLIETSTVYENVELPLLYGGYGFAETKEKVRTILAKVGLEGKENKYPKQLSGGQQQRVAIARALITQPKFVIADEPTGALDSKTSTEILELFQTLNQETGATMILVTHDPELVPYCHRLIRIRDGAIVADEEVKV